MKVGDMSKKKNILVQRRGHFKRTDQWDEELERLHRLVRDLELEARGRRQRRNHEEHA